LEPASLRKVTQLRDALTEDRCDPEARQAVRNMVEEIGLTPRDGVLAVGRKGESGGDAVGG